MPRRVPAWAQGLIFLPPFAQAVSVVGLSIVLVFGLSSIALVGLAPIHVSVSLGALFFGLLIVSQSMARSYPHSVIGWCNTATLFRLVLVAWLLGAIFASVAPWAIVVVSTLAFALDGVDGWLARREGLSSEFGARFDVEVDSVFALILAVLVAQKGEVGVYVILLGLPRYIYGAAQMGISWLNGDLHPRFSRKVVCVAQIAALILLLLPVSLGPLAWVLVIGTAVALIWSFGLDIRWLSRNRR